MKPNGLWRSLGVSEAELEAKAEWISRDHPGFPDSTVMFFRTAGSLIRFSQYDFALLALAFFQSVIGLERMLRHHYGSVDSPFKVLFIRAVEEGLISDASFSHIVPFPRDFSQHIAAEQTTYAGKLAHLVPELRNGFFHGSFHLRPEFLHLALQVREAVDSLLQAPCPAGPGNPTRGV
jgi:hypothetical protein